MYIYTYIYKIHVYMCVCVSHRNPDSMFHPSNLSIPFETSAQIHSFSVYFLQHLNIWMIARLPTIFPPFAWIERNWYRWGWYRCIVGISFEISISREIFVYFRSCYFLPFRRNSAAMKFFYFLLRDSFNYFSNNGNNFSSNDSLDSINFRNFFS